MPDTESGASLLAKREYARAVPLLKADLDKYPNNPRIRLQYADALAGSGQNADAIEQYEATSKYYEDNGLTVQAIAVRKKAEKLSALSGAKPAAAEPGKDEPFFKHKVPKSPLFEVLNDEERDALAKFPGIRRVLDEFYKRRAKHTVEAMIENLKKKGS